MGILRKNKLIKWLFPGKEKPSATTPLTGSVQAKTSGTDKTDKKISPDSKVYTHQRRYPRHPIEGKNVNAHLLFSEEVVFQNLSVSGACILTIKDIPVGGRYLLRILDNEHPISPQCTVIWKLKHENNEEMFNGYLAGLTFTSPTFEEIVKLKDFMRMYGEPDDRTISDSFTPSALRYFIKEGEKALLNRHEILGVKTISLGGMLIESSRQMKINGKYSMKIRTSAKDDPIKIKGRIASIFPSSDSASQAYNVGVEFLDMEVPDKVMLEKFIQSI